MFIVKSALTSLTLLLCIAQLASAKFPKELSLAYGTDGYGGDIFLLAAIPNAPFIRNEQQPIWIIADDKGQDILWRMRNPPLHPAKLTGIHIASNGIPFDATRHRIELSPNDSVELIQTKGIVWIIASHSKSGIRKFRTIVPQVSRLRWEHQSTIGGVTILRPRAVMKPGASLDDENQWLGSMRCVLSDQFDILIFPKPHSISVTFSPHGLNDRRYEVQRWFSAGTEPADDKSPANRAQ